MLVYFRLLNGLINTMHTLDTILDRLSSWFLRQTVAANGYYVAGFHLMTIGVACLIFNTSPVFVQMQNVFPLFSGYFWAIAFCLFAVLTSKIKRAKTEFPSIVLTFIVPIAFFYGLLFAVNVTSRGMFSFTSVLIALGAIMPSFAVLRSVALAYYRAYAAVLELNLRKATTRIAELEKIVSGQNDSRRLTETSSSCPDNLN